MAKKNIDYKNNKKSNIKNNVSSSKSNENIEKTFGMKILVFLGVIISLGICLYLMNYFFVEKSYLKINISTDKRVDYIKVNGKEESILTQKYVSDLNYSMRYDIDKFKVYKYKKQDIFKYLNAEKILVIVEKSTLPKNCVNKGTELYNSCVVTVDDFSKEYYISKNNETYKLTVKTPGPSDYKDEIKERINFMLSTFETTKNR